MDFPAIANSVMNILVPYLLKMGEPAVEGIGKSLYEIIKKKLHSDPDTKGTLNRLEKNPADADRQQAVENILKEKMQEDRVFAEQLKQAVPASQNNGKVIIQEVINSGNSRNGPIIQIGEINNPPLPRKK